MVANIPKKKKTNFKKCDFPECTEEGCYRAPKNKNLSDYYWFCLKHVKEYNKNWNFLSGLSPEEIEQNIQHDVKWQRPTWKLGEGNPKKYSKITGKFDSFIENGLGMDGKYRPIENKSSFTKEYSKACSFMEIKEENLSLAVLKKNYKKLAKKYHPDLNNGDKKLEQKFQKLQSAYQYLLKWLNKS